VENKEFYLPSLDQWPSSPCAQDYGEEPACFGDCHPCQALAYPWEKPIAPAITHPSMQILLSSSLLLEPWNELLLLLPLLLHFRILSLSPLPSSTSGWRPKNPCSSVLLGQSLNLGQERCKTLLQHKNVL